VRVLSIAGWREALFALPRRLFGGAVVPSTEGDLAGADYQVRTDSSNLIKLSSFFSFKNEYIYTYIHILT
jgi:hypothetical protein